jgi:hypothetical protein
MHGAIKMRIIFPTYVIYLFHLNSKCSIFIFFYYSKFKVFIFHIFQEQDKKKKKKNKITLKSERDNDFNDLAASSGGTYDFDNFDEDFI